MLRKILSLVSNSDFIGVYDNSLTSQECGLLINQFQKSKVISGKVYKGSELEVDSSIKSSFEIDGSFFSDGSVISNLIKIKLRECAAKYGQQFRAPALGPSANLILDDPYTFKKFEGKDGGYKDWHSEHGVGNPNRVLVWMFYLNNAAGTDFMYYPTVRAKMGRCIIWPAGFTHTHKSSPNTGVKYIVSGWMSTS